MLLLLSLSLLLIVIIIIIIIVVVVVVIDSVVSDWFVVQVASFLPPHASASSGISRCFNC